MKFVDQYDDKGFTDPSRDQPNKRSIHLDDGRTINLERRDPYGFVHVVWYNGVPPKELQGVYTAFDTATKAVTIWINNNLFAKESPVAVEKVPPIQYKKAYRDKVTGENLSLNA